MDSNNNSEESETMQVKIQALVQKAKRSRQDESDLEATNIETESPKRVKFSVIHGSLDKKERRESRRLKIKTEKLGEESSVQISMLSNEKKSRRWTVSGDEETLSKRTEEKPISTKVLGPSINRRKNVAKKSAPAFRPEGAQKPPRKARKGNSFLDFFSSPFKVNPKTLFAPSEEEKNREMSKIKIIAKRITADGKTAYLVKRN